MNYHPLLRWPFILLMVLGVVLGYLLGRSILVRAASPVLLAVGDIASCGSAGDEATAKLVDTLPGIIALLGDTVYEAGTAAEFAECYEPAWGRHKSRIRPSVGNHEYGTSGAAPYFDYFGAAAGDPDKGYYSYDLGTWHIIVLNSNCARIGGCHAGSAQEQWLRADLAAHPTSCTLAYWHHPLFSSGSHGNFDQMQPIWQTLYEAGTDVILNGHDHSYERFFPQNASGQPDPAHGIRQFVVGTGGKNHTAFTAPIANSEVRNADTFGVLKLTLHTTSYDWQFVPVADSAFTDSGSGSCSLGSGSIDPGRPTTGALTPEASAAAPAASQTIGGALPFADSFEQGDLAAWSSAVGLEVRPQEGIDGTYGARAIGAGKAAYAFRQLSPPQHELFYRIKFKLLSQPTSTLYLQRFRSGSGDAISGSLLGIYINSAGKLSYRNDLTDKSTSSKTAVSDGVWHELQARLRIDGDQSQVELWLDGVRIDELSTTEPLGTSPIGRVQLGESANDKTFAVVFDDVAVDARFISE
ncbi:MAG TPA: metallophosphoesterase [Herpetosiphonaceae bacterium]